LGYAIGFHHEHQRWDRDQLVAIRYENIKPGRAHDYDWIAQTNWLVTSVPYDSKFIMHYRACWASGRENECMDGCSPGVVISPVGPKYNDVIGQWTDNGIRALDAEKARWCMANPSSSRREEAQINFGTGGVYKNREPAYGSP